MLNKNQMIADPIFDEIFDLIDNEGELAKKLEELIDSNQLEVLKKACLLPKSISLGEKLRVALDDLLCSKSIDGTFRLDFVLMPMVLIVGARKDTSLSTVLSDVNALKNVLDENGVLGHCKNFGFGACLVDYDTLRKSGAESWLRLLDNGFKSDLSPIHFPQKIIEIKANREEAHLRYLCGVALSPVNAPSIFESAGDLGRWGLKLAEVISKQIEVPDCSVLGLPKSPKTFFRSLVDGYWSVREVGFQLFVSSTLNQARLKLGDPDVTINAMLDEKLTINFSSKFDDTFDRTFVFPIAPYETMDAALVSIREFLRDVSISRYLFVDKSGREEYIDCSI